MKRFLLLAILAGGSLAVAAPPVLGDLLKSVEARYNKAQTLQVPFTESYSAQGRGRQQESGTLSLRKPGRMRWDYTQPAGKLFLSDGKNLFLYTPETNRVEKMKAKESDDMRAPLAFLFGKLHFEKDFQNFEARPEGENTWISADPKSPNLPYSRVEFLVTPQSQIRSVKVTGQDKSLLTFQFGDEKVNPALSNKLFDFQAPPGAQIAEAAQ